MENRPDSKNKAPAAGLTLHLDPEILNDLKAAQIDLSQFTMAPSSEARLALFKRGDRLWVNWPDGEHCDLPYYLKNTLFVLSGALNVGLPARSPVESFESLLKTNQSLEKKTFSHVSMPEGQNVKDLWDEVIKKINAISSESHGLGSLVEKLLDVPFLQNFQTSMVVLHIKGQTKAGLLGTLWRSERHQGLIEVQAFNSFYNSIKKSKIKSFHTDAFPKLGLPFNGSFLAKEVSSKKYSMVALASRHDFLSFTKDEIELYETCIDLLQPHFERLVDQEFSDKRISELRICLKDFPLPLRVKDTVSGATFNNDLFHGALQDKDIFFSKRVQGPFNLDLYDSDELRHYAFDLFHFQRISLLGELLNTLRHELSNPLFGLKLGSQIFKTLGVAGDEKEIMEEIEKNVNRCQVIMENFSNLYQAQSEARPVSIKKIIDESMVLSKSETREMRKAINYLENSENIELNVPLIFVVQILFNLIVNSSQAVKQAGGQGEIILTIMADEQTVRIDLRDNGPGIPADKLGQLFRPFFTTKPQGTGLGLVLSRNLAVKMGGNLEYLADNKVQGAHFRLTLPKS